jgi:hypothetical protein
VGRNGKIRIINILQIPESVVFGDKYQNNSLLYGKKLVLLHPVFGTKINNLLT